MQLKNDLWDFALNFYQQPGVETACLLLQEQFGLSINRIIYASWCGCQGHALSLEELTGLADQWQGSVTHPLRAIRYKVRAIKEDEPDVEACYQKLRQAELACEQVELAMLYSQVKLSSVSEGSVDLAYQNLIRYFETQPVNFDTELELAVGPILSALNHILGCQQA